MAFAPAALSRLQPGRQGRPPRLLVHFLGLLGPNGPLPLHLTQYARLRLGEGDATLVRFLDVFHHRLISLFYRAWAMNQPTVACEQGDADAFARYVGSMCGLGLPACRKRDAVPDLAKFHYAGQLAARPANAAGLAAVLTDDLGVEARVRQFVGQWIDLPANARCRLGESRKTGALGQTAIVGQRVWDCQGRFRLRVGPLNLADYRRFLPGGGSLKRLSAWVSNYAGLALEWDLQLVLRAAEVPKTQLGSFGRLGWSTWLLSGPVEADADDLVLQPSSAAATASRTGRDSASRL
jgi:type VI secretion system protein ImpH